MSGTPRRDPDLYLREGFSTHEDNCCASAKVRREGSRRAGSDGLASLLVGSLRVASPRSRPSPRIALRMIIDAIAERGVGSPVMACAAQRGKQIHCRSRSGGALLARLVASSTRARASHSSGSSDRRRGALDVFAPLGVVRLVVVIVSDARHRRVLRVQSSASTEPRRIAANR